MRLIMSGTAPTVRISAEDSRNFYENVYKAHAHSEQSLAKLSEAYANEIAQNGLAMKQYEYKALSEDFLAVVKERKIPIETVVNSLGLADETWSIWKHSLNLGAKTTPVTFNNAIVNKMAGMVLKDLVLKHLESKGLNEYNQDVLDAVISQSKVRLEVNSSALNATFEMSDNTPNPEKTNTPRNKIKP